MRCHYEVLGAARDASLVEIKKAFRLQALRWHPDKHHQNKVSSEEATEKFQTIQNAYEVLSDPHEKKWYDEHREHILRGGDGDNNEENDLDLFRYFSASVYAGFGTDVKSFYSVYGDIFTKIDGLDMDASAGSRSERAPELGDVNTSMKDVNYFYQHWKSYTTQRSFAWVDEYKTTDAPTRLVRRAMEKENKKLRDAAKKTFTTEVRELVDFVCRRDPRVREFQKQKQQEKRQRCIEEEANKREKQAAYDAERRVFQEQQEKLWAHTSMETSSVADRHIEQELEKLRKKMEAEVLVCDLCSKIFKSMKQLQNHVTSKKHREREEELGVFSDISILDDEMDRELQEEFGALGKVKHEANSYNDATVKLPVEVRQDDVKVDDAKRQEANEEALHLKAEADRVRLEKEQKAAEKRRERKAVRKNKKKENVENIVSSARSKKEKEEEEENQRSRGKKGGKKRR